MEQSGRYVLELAEFIPIRNINFYIDSYVAMSSVDLSGISSAELKEYENIWLTGHFRLRDHIDHVQVNFPGTNGSERHNRMKALGKFLLTRLLRPEISENDCPSDVLPFVFLGSAIMADLRIHEHGQSYEFVKNFLDDLAERNIVDPAFVNLQGACIKARSEQYGYEDLATILLGYSIARNGSLQPIVPFPSNPLGFVAVLQSELNKLLLK